MNDSPETQAYRLVSDESYEEAAEEGYIRWLPSTQIDPGCYDRDLDIELKDFQRDEDAGIWTAQVFVYLGGSLLYERFYAFYMVGEYMHCDMEEA